jgi:hypothetical protein
MTSDIPQSQQGLLCQTSHLTLPTGAVTRAVLPALQGPGAAGRLLGYAVLLHLWSMPNELAHWHGRGDITTWQPSRALTALAAGDGG